MAQGHLRRDRQAELSESQRRIVRLREKADTEAEANRQRRERGARIAGAIRAVRALDRSGS